MGHDHAGAHLEQLVAAEMCRKSSVLQNLALFLALLCARAMHGLWNDRTFVLLVRLSLQSGDAFTRQATRYFCAHARTPSWQCQTYVTEQGTTPRVRPPLRDLEGLPAQLRASDLARNDTPASCWPRAPSPSPRHPATSTRRFRASAAASALATTGTAAAARQCDKIAAQQIALDESVDAWPEVRPVVSEPLRVIAWIDEDNHILASPSIVRLDSGRLLVVYERVPRHGAAHAPNKTVRARTRHLCAV